MSTPEGGLPSAGVTSTPETGASTATDSPSVSQGTSSTPPEQIASGVTTDVQGAAPQQPPDPFADLPSVEELNQQADQGVKYAKALANLRGVIEPLRTQNGELTQKYQGYDPYIERFQSPDELQRVLDLNDSLIAWESDPETGQPIPATEAGAQKLAQLYPRHADYLAADLIQMPTIDPETGRQVPRIDLVLEEMANIPEQRARVLKMFGAVEPSAVAPQWQPTPEELSAISVDPQNPTPEEKALQDIYRKLPYEEREELKLASPEFIRRTLQREKLTQELTAVNEQTQQRDAQVAQQREQYVNQQAQQAAQTYVDDQLKQALTTFHESVVQQCNFLAPLDAQNLPQGVDPQQVPQINQQIASANKAEAAQITGLVVSLFNPQTKAYVLPLLKEIGAVDDKLLTDLDAAASAFGNSARNFGNLSFRERLQANGNGYQAGPDVTQLNTAAQKALKTMVIYANKIKSNLMENRSRFFELRASQHNQTLNGTAGGRPSITGTGYDPTTAVGAPPRGFQSKDELMRLYG